MHPPPASTSPSDLFYSFPAHPVDPTRPESHGQNEAIVAALGATSAAFLRHHYDVFVDGIVGPWFLPRLLEEIPSRMEVAYVLLTVSEDVALARVRNREGTGRSARVCATRSAFDAAPDYATHEVDTTKASPEDVFHRVAEGLASGRFLLDRA
ncbi:MAG: AAA family ATPase [Spirochaetaceae bacterium]|nr:AAA family ATPase [Spirochaetaceae bacterium]